jgi:flagellar FliL protein
MSAAAATASAAAPAAVAPTGRKKKLVLVGVVALVVLLLVAGGGWSWLQVRAAKAAAEAAEEGDDALAEAPGKAHGSKAAPTFMPLEPFVVNLADRDVDRFAQIGVTLELTDPAAVDRMKAFMPAIRNGILLVLADKKSEELLAREGKEKLAAEILRESVRPLGIETKAPRPVTDDGEGKVTGGKPAQVKKGKAEAPAQPNPVQRVHFSSFIIQ